MVLEEASGPPSTDTPFSERPPASDADPYSQQNPPFTSTRKPSFTPVNEGQDQIYVDIANLPQPYILGSQRQHAQILAKGIQDQCNFAANILRRPVSQQEADAFAYHFARSIKIASLGSPLGFAVSQVVAYRSRATYRFPGWTPFSEGGKLRPDSFGPLKGQMARIAWHSTRLAAYGIVGSTLGQIFYGSYALTVSLAGRARDTRLREFNEALQQRQKDGLGAERPSRDQDATSTTQQETFEQRRQRRAVQAQAAAPRRRDDDDMSPTGGAFESELLESSGGSDFVSDDDIRKRDISDRSDQQPSSPARSEAGSARSAISKHQSQPDSRTSRSSESTTPRNAPEQSSGSVWERLRQGAMNSNEGNQPSSSRTAGTPQRVKQEQKQSSTVGDSFSFSEDDEQRQLAKSEAQSDFDSRLERERSGKDFSDAGNGKGRW